MKKYFLVFVVALTSAPLFSALWLMNGNFSLSFTDVDEGNALVISRYYNSLGPSRGMFGYGWGTQMEARLSAVAGPLVMIEEAPSGGRSHYIDKTKDTPGSIVDKLIKLSNAAANGKEYITKLRQNILRDTVLIYQYAKTNNLKAEKIAEGTVLENVERQDEKLKKIKNGYVRIKPDGSTDQFDNEGRLAKRTLVSGRHLVFDYDGRGNLSAITDSLGRSIKLYIGGKGLLDKIVLYNNKVATYSYDDQNNLVESTDANGKTYKYKYNSYHKVIEVVYGKEKWTIGYDSNNGKVVYQKTPDGWEIFTEYASDKSKDQYYDKISLIKKYANEVVSEVYEMWKRPRPDGSLYMYKSREKIGDKEKTITFTMCCSTPLVVNDNGKITRYEYNKDGKLKKKVHPDGRVITVDYDAGGRITSIVNNNRPYKFQYNSKGQIVLAASNVAKFKMDYDGNGNLSKVLDTSGNQFSIKYDELGRMNELVTNYGSIRLAYERDNTPVRIESSGSDQNMSKMQGVYQDYLDLMSVFKLADIDM
ncbi:MAG: DUF6531 domain-containing protein [Pseudomonadota bacterium]